MPTQSNIRPILFKDLIALKSIIDSNGLFPSDMLDNMMSDYFKNEDTNEIWFTYADDKPVAIAYCAPERMTEGTWNLYLIAVHRDLQGKGIGTEMMHYIEQLLTTREARILLVETSSLSSFEGTRQFYQKCGYEPEARIREFYQVGEDKIIFRKSLNKNSKS